MQFCFLLNNFSEGFSRKKNNSWKRKQPFIPTWWCDMAISLHKLPYRKKCLTLFDYMGIFLFTRNAKTSLKRRIEKDVSIISAVNSDWGKKVWRLIRTTFNKENVLFPRRKVNLLLPGKVKTFSESRPALPKLYCILTYPLAYLLVLAYLPTYIHLLT